VRHDDDLPIDPDLAPDEPSGPRMGSPPGAVSAGRTRRARPDVLVAVAVGGAIGTILRAALGELFTNSSLQFPSTTLGINLAGSFALGLILVPLVERFGPAPRLRPFLTTGILGGFTTFSTFMVESVQLGRHGRVGLAITYVTVSTVGGIIAAFVGIVAGRALADRTVLGHRAADPTEDAGELS